MSSSVPSFWRIELLHPFSVHFPVAFLVFCICSELCGLILWQTKYYLPVRRTTLLLALTGTLSAWVAVYTGGLAEEVVNRAICDPTATKAHEALAWKTTYLFSLLSLVFIFRERYSLLQTYRGLRAVWVTIWVIGLASASYLLLKTGHSGAELVFQQGAGVYNPSATCQEFE